MKIKYFIFCALFVCSAIVYSQQDGRSFRSVRHFTGITNTGNNMTIGIPDFAWQAVPEIGDEVGIYNSNGYLVGSCVYQGGHSAVAVWGDDETTSDKEGVQSGDRFTMKLWSNSTGMISLLEVESWLEGDDIYQANGISIVEKLKTIPIGEISADFSLSQNVPNPVREHTTIEFSLPRKVYVEISLYTASGELVDKLLAKELPAGPQKLEFDPAKYAAGNYCYKMTAADFTATKTMNIAR